jgi:hypothetical protein
MGIERDFLDLAILILQMIQVIANNIKKENKIKSSSQARKK